MSDLLNAEQIAERKSVHVMTVHRWHRYGLLPKPCQTRPFRWKLQDIEVWEKSDKAEAAEIDNKERKEMEAKKDATWTNDFAKDGTPIVKSGPALGRPRTKQTYDELQRELSSAKAALGLSRAKVRGRKRPDGVCLEQFPVGETKSVRGLDAWLMATMGFVEILPWENVLGGPEVSLGKGTTEQDT